jgi:hypothetical protein
MLIAPIHLEGTLSLSWSPLAIIIIIIIIIMNACLSAAMDVSLSIVLLVPRNSVSARIRASCMQSVEKTRHA